MEKPTYTAVPGSLEMVITHKFDAPVDLVYRIYTDPKLIPDWWGPRNLTTTIEKAELRPGGIWRYIQRDPQNNIFAFHGVYHSIEPNKRIISTFEWEGMPGHVIFETTEFREQDGKTTVIQQEIFQSVQDRDGMIQQGMEQGIIEGDERFNEILNRMRNGQTMMESMAYPAHDGASLEIIREFNASPERVWQEWTNPDLYACWWGPKDASSDYNKIDLQVGGKYLSNSHSPDGRDVWNTGTYKEISEPNRLVMTLSFADEQGTIVPASYYGMGSDIPMEMEVEVCFDDLGGKTRLAIEQCGLPEGLFREQTIQGWNESLDKLADCLR